MSGPGREECDYSLIHRLAKLTSAAGLIFLVMAWPALSQQAPPNSYSEFEGRTVSAVEISANPSMNLDAFRALVTQKMGEPFSTGKILTSVAALEQTKEFSKVDVNVEPEPSGLRVVFILEPTSYVGMLSFPGALRVFSYVRLLQAVNIPEQTPYTSDLLPQGQKALLQFLRSSGYFAASVQPEIQRDDPHRIVNLVFHTDLGRKAKVGDIHIEGVSAQQSEQIQKALRSFRSKLTRKSLRPGMNYSTERVAKATDFIRSDLHSENHLAPLVRHASTDYDPNSNRAAVAFQVNPGPVVSVRLSGVHVSKRTLRRQIPIYEENSVDRDLVDEGERNLVSYFQSKGYFYAQVNSEYSQDADQVTVVYQVDRGARHRLEGVYFQGNRHFDDSQLRAVISTKKGLAVLGHTFSHGRFSDALVTKSVDSIVVLYKNDGFAQARVSPKIVNYDPLVDVTFEISEGEQDKVASLRLEGNRTQTLAALSGNTALNLQPGKPYSPHLLENDRNRLLAAYLDRGYLNVTFQSAVSPSPASPHSMNVVYTINEGPQGHVSEVILLGPRVTKPRFVRTITDPNVNSGDPLSEGKFFKTESDLYNLGIFDWASVKPLRPISDQNQEEVLIKVHESKRNTLDLGGGIEVIPRSGNIPVGAVALPGLPPIGLGTKFSVSQKSFFGPRGSFAIGRHDLRGRAETATFSAVVSRLDQSGAFTYTDPHFHGSSWSSLFSISAERTTENPLYTADLGQGSLQVEKALDTRKTKNLILRYSFQRTDLSKILIPDLILPADQRIRLSTLSAEYIRDSRDKPLDAHHGLYQTFNFGVTPTALGSSANFVRFLGQNAFYMPVRPWLTWANNVRLGFAIPFSGSVVPLSERFFSGGADSLRGFPINGAGPQRPVSVCSNPSDASSCTIISVPVGGDMLFILNSEARFPIKFIRNLGGVFFYDGGNVYSNINFSQLIDDYTNTVGLGVRYQTPVGPVRLDFGYRLTSIPGVKATQYYVTLGQSF